MRNFFLLVCTLFLASCGSSDPAEVNNDSTPGNVIPRVNNDCDSTLFPDFKNNLEDVLITVYPQYLEDMGIVADSFITAQCAFDSLLCGEIYQKHVNLYQSPDGYELFSIGYAYVESDSTMSPESASLFVFGVRKNGETLFYDIEEDILGEIQFQLRGFETDGKKMIIWGESYLYFAHEYGKFKLTIDGSQRTWQYMCKSGSGKHNG